jgi:hypothetical protein
MPRINADRKSRRGHPKLDKAECRNNCVSVRLNDAELALLEKRRGGLKKGEWLRMAALDELPPMIPEVNRQAWVALARAHSNINQIAAKLNRGDLVDVASINAEIAEFRRKLIGFKSDEEGDDA